MWDVDDSGYINLQEMTNIVATMDDVEGVEQDPKVSKGVSLMLNILKFDNNNAFSLASYLDD